MKLLLKYTGIILLVNFIFAVAVYAQEGKISGKVKDNTGDAIEDVVITAYSESIVKNSNKTPSKEKKAETKSDKKGRFNLTKLAPGQYSLTFEKQGYKTFYSRKIDVATDETVVLKQAATLSKEDEPYSIVRGAVLYGAGFTLRNAEVTIERIDGDKKFKLETISQDGGEFAFRLKADKAKYKITAKAKGFTPSSIEIDISNDEVRNIALTLKQEF